MNGLVNCCFKQASWSAPLHKFQFDRFNGTYIRNRIVRNQSIDDLIPEPVLQYLNEIDGFTRIRKFIQNP